MSNVGRMDGAFFVSRTELISWLNSFFALSISKVEQCANGAVYCQVIDASHPGSVPMKKVNWNARDEHQCIPNYKVLQQAFEKVGITRHVEVDKLVRGKYQDNLEMLQWIKTYFDRNFQGADYDAPARRAGTSLPDWAKCSEDQPHAAYAPPSRGAPRSSTASGSSAGPRGAAPRAGVGSRGPVLAPRGTASAVPQAEFDGLRDEHEKLRDEVVDLKITVDGLETERDFYFQKLRDIEILCQTLEAHPDPNMTVNKFVENVQRILYAKDDEEEDGLDDCDPP